MIAGAGVLDANFNWVPCCTDGIAFDPVDDFEVSHLLCCVVLEKVEDARNKRIMLMCILM